MPETKKTVFDNRHFSVGYPDHSARGIISPFPQKWESASQCCPGVLAGWLTQVPARGGRAPAEKRRIPKPSAVAEVKQLVRNKHASQIIPAEGCPAHEA